MNIKFQHILSWLNKCKKNMEEFDEIYKSLSKEEKLKYIRQQYRLISLISNVMTNKTKISGYNFEIDKLDKNTIKQNIKSQVKV